MSYERTRYSTVISIIIIIEQNRYQCTRQERHSVLGAQPHAIPGAVVGSSVLGLGPPGKLGSWVMGLPGCLGLGPGIWGQILEGPIAYRDGAWEAEMHSFTP